MPLTLVREGTVASIVRVGGKEEVKRHLENMGFVPGASVTVVSANNGNVIVNVKNQGLLSAKRWPIRLWCKLAAGMRRKGALIRCAH